MRANLFAALAGFLGFTLFMLPARAAQGIPEPAPSQKAPAAQDVAVRTSGASPDPADSLVLADGTPVYLRVQTGFSSEKAKTGDVIHFEVAFDVQASDVVVIPRNTSVTGRIVSVKAPGRFAKDGVVALAFDSFSLPSGETATVRPVKKAPSKAAKVGQAAAGVPGEAGATFITAGIALFALPFVKGNEQVVTGGTVEAVFLNGPLRLSRRALTSVQPAHGYVDIFAWGRRKDHSPPKFFCGEKILADHNGVFQFELNPGTYWFSTERIEEQPVRVEVLPGHEYIVERAKRALIAREFHPGKGLTYFQNAASILMSLRNATTKDLTKITPEEYRALTAGPERKGGGISLTQKP